MKKIILCSIILFTVSCKDPIPQPPKEQEIKAEGDQVIIPESSPVLKKISTLQVNNQEYNHDITSVGTIEAIPNNYAEIASPFSGRVTKAFVTIGQKVNAGSPLFEVLSSGYLDIQKEYSDALNEAGLAEKKYKRQQDLVKHGVGIQKELEEAETEFKNKKISLSNASTALKIYNSQGKSSGGLIVRAPIQGEVISNKIVTGQYLREDAEPVMVVAELSKVWISGEVKEKDLRFIRNGDQVSVKVSTYPDRAITGKVYHINDWVDEATRSIKVLIQCDNPDRTLKPGMFATITYSTDSENTIIIPTSALMQKDDHQYVWLKTGKNRFTKRDITTAEASEKTVKVTSGLTTGDEIMTTGGIYLLDVK
ncbi:efflux RND transporter periplasmic adaptor subunit [Chryseobacterium pennipullorum]|uniref:Efflux RND transporter periplasmic adaptor subunit n=1 Tax=Chryseobacterium pennipullorum TaxID=2258963 RepID=A0A3D9B2R2_9FLAO|nr:efflux RND transporter periplasmic adaptor subunit [Chryseobacterium pennipullorum]REC47930.1 efflux RND transporter periplasmic adaptor subunit [Chryseobacterium pennipullorum]